MNSHNDSCYVKITTTFAGITIQNKTSDTPSTSPNIMGNYYCNYYGVNSTVHDYSIIAKNENVFKQSCYALSSLGCCGGSGIALVQNNQIAAAQGQINVFPPCFLNYMRTNCSTLSLTNQCTKGSIANQTTLQGFFTVTKNPANNQTKALFPNVYTQKGVVQVQGQLTNVMSSLGLSVEPYHFSTSYPFQVYLTGYIYYNGEFLLFYFCSSSYFFWLFSFIVIFLDFFLIAAGTQLTPTNGYMAYPPGSDYTQASKGTFYYQVVVQNLDDQQATYLQTVLSSTSLTSPSFALMVTKYFASLTPAVIGITANADVYEADPLPVSAASERFSTLNSFLLFVLLFVGMKISFSQQ
jgi:hypothetical protein